MTVAEAIYIVLDEVKAHSDDSDVTEAHVLFLLKKYRSLLLKKQYLSKASNTPSSNNVQTICVELENSSTYNDDCTETFKKSKIKIPNLLLENSLRVYPVNYKLGINFTIVPKERFPFIGHNKYTKSIIYCYIDDDHYLCFDSSRVQTNYLNKVKVSGVFEDIDKAAELSCSTEETCDPMQQVFPIEDALVPELLQSVIKEVLGVAYRPKDNTNDATDGLSDIINWARRNMKNDLQKQIE